MAGLRIRRFFPILDWVQAYQKGWLRADIIAGLTAAAVVIPKAMAYATIAGLPVQVGLYTVFVPLVIYAVLGTSRVLSTSTTTTIAILVGAQLAVAVPDGDAAALLAASATLALLVGVFLIVACFLRLGFLANYISEPILVGFKAGIGVVIVVDQIPKLLGIHFDKGSFVENVLAIVSHVPETSIPTLIVGVAMLVILVGLERFVPRVPAPLVAVAAGIAAMAGLGLAEHGVKAVGVLPTGLPSPLLPDLGLIAALWPAALGIALMSFTESTAAARAFATKDEPRPVANQELLATGIANVGGALTGAMAAGGGTSQTAVNRLAGARTQVAQLVTAACAVLTMLFLAPLISLMPKATLAAVVIVYSIGLIGVREFTAIFRIRWMEFIWAVAAFLGVVLIGTLEGIAVAIVLSLLSLIYQISSPPLHVMGRKPGTNVFRPISADHPEDEIFPGLLIVQPEGRLFYANAQNYSEKILPLIDELKPKFVVFDLSRVFDLEYTALKMLTEAEERHRSRGVLLSLAGLNPSTLETVRRSPLGEVLGRERTFFNVQDAVAQYLRDEDVKPQPVGER